MRRSTIPGTSRFPKATAVHLSGENAVAASGLMHTAGILGGVVSTSLTPVIVKYFGWMTALGSGAAVALACTATWFVIGRRKLVNVADAALDAE